MSWSEILNHDSVVERFRKNVSRGRLASTYLFVGPSGIGKRTFALKLAEALLCETNSEIDLDPCGQCPACLQVRAATHPDLILVSKPDGKNFIPVETFIGDREHRRQVGLVHDIGLKPFRGGRKIAIIDDADFLNQESANSLLKTLEEPPPKSLLILIGTSAQKQLSTIVSRSQLVRFNPLTNDNVAELLSRKQLVGDEVNLDDLVRASQGSLEMAAKLSSAEAFEFRNGLFDQLSTLDPAADEYAKTISTFVDGVGKDAAAKRQRTILIGEFAISFFRQLVNRIACNHTTGEIKFDQAIERTRNSLTQLDVNKQCMAAAECIEKTIEMQKQISANANIANVNAVWLRDLRKVLRNEPAVPV